MAALLADAAIEGVVVDTGFPDPDVVLPAEVFGRLGNVQQVTLRRLEPFFQQLVAVHNGYDDLTEVVRAGLADVRASGHAGCKSIAAYRTGLIIERWPGEEARTAFTAARREITATGTVR